MQELTFLVSLLVFLVLAEILARLYVQHLYSQRTGRKTSFWLYPQEWSLLVPKILRYQSHPYIIYVKKPGFAGGGGPLGSFASNNHGFEGTRDIALEKPAGKFRIICLGASNTEENRDPEPDRTYPDFLEVELNKVFNGCIEVLNAGNTAYTSVESLNNLMLRLLDFKPDMIVYYEGINDVFSAALLDGFRSDYAHSRKNVPIRPGILMRLPSFRWSFCYSSIRTKLMRRFAMTRGLVEHINHYPLKPAKSFQPQAIRVFKRNIKSLCAVALAHGIVPVLVPFSYNPALKKGLPSRALKIFGMAHCQQWMLDYLDANNEALPEVAREVKGVEYVDVPFLEENWFVPKDECHLTTEGVRELAARIAKGLIPLVREKMNAFRGAA
jgi:lysophospholipase L1-like esterase